MAKNSWPTGVTSWDDTVKFARLLFGRDVQLDNHRHRLPHRSTESFLKKTKRFVDTELPGITAAMRVSSPSAPLSEEHLAKLRLSKIENCRKNWRRICSNMAMWLERTGRTSLAACWKERIEMPRNWMFHSFVCRQQTKDIPGGTQLWMRNEHISC